MTQPEESFIVSLRIRHPTLTSEPIVESIGMLPEFCHSVGTPRKTPTGQLLDGLYDQTYCTFPLTKKKLGRFDDGVRELMPRLAFHAEYFRQLRASGGSAELYIGVFFEDWSGFELGCQDMKALADLGLDLGVELYGNSESGKM